MDFSTSEDHEMLPNKDANQLRSLDGEIHSFTSSYAEGPFCDSSLNAYAPDTEGHSSDDGASDQDEQRKRADNQRCNCTCNIPRNWWLEKTKDCRKNLKVRIMKSDHVWLTKVESLRHEKRNFS